MASSLEIFGVAFTGNVLGSGAYAEVTEVEWCNTRCAAKKMHEVFLRTLSKDELSKLIKDFERESDTWSKLRHPNIVQLLGIYYQTFDRVPVFVLEKMSTSLRHYLEKHGREDFLLPDKVSILCQVVQGLCYLHNQRPSLVHHDLTPNNILMNEVTFQTKLTDFGMTRAISLTKSARYSSIKGTLVFMPPEALCVPPNYDGKLDIFSFGNCVTTLLTHQWPNPSHPTVYEGNKLIALTEFDRRSHQIELMTKPEKDTFLPLVQRCLENHASARPESADLLKELRQIEATLENPTTHAQMRLLYLERQNSDLRQKLEESQLREESQSEDRAALLLEREELLTSIEHLNQQVAKLEEVNHHLYEENIQFSKTLVISKSATESETLQSDVAHSESTVQEIQQKRVWNDVGQCRQVLRDQKERHFFALAVSSSDLLVATDCKNSCVCVFDAYANLTRVIEVGKGRVFGFLAKKIESMPGIAFIENDNVVISDRDGCCLLVYSYMGVFIRNIHLKGKPWGLAVKDNRIYSCEEDRSCISVHKVDGQFCFEFGSKGKGEGQFNFPKDAAFGPDGNIYVTDLNNERIQVFSEDGVFVKEYPTDGKPEFLCVSHHGDVIVRVDRGIVLVYNNDGNLVYKWEFQTNQFSFGVAIKQNGNIFLSDWKDIKVF